MADNYKFSVIMPIYNTEEYLTEAIDSLVSQSIGFNNIQVILVDNASTDGSSDICKQYSERYPDNVIYIRLDENVGPSGARNAGIPYVEGRYVNFFDSDDIWPDNAFSSVWSFFEKNKRKVDVVACRMKFFEARWGYYPELDPKFEDAEELDRVCSIEREYTALQLHVTSAFIKRAHVTAHQFDTTMNHLEDSKYINTIILNRMRYGLLGSVEYQYRSRSNKTSLLNNVRKTSPSYFKHTLDKYLFYFVDLSKEKFGVVIPYVQWMIAYTVGNRLKEHMTLGIVSDEEYDEYRASILDLLNIVEDSILMEVNTMWDPVKVHAMHLKYPDLFSKVYCANRVIAYKNAPVFDFDKKSILNINLMELYDNTVFMYGQLSFPFPESDYDFYFSDNLNRKYEVTYDQYDKEIKSLGIPFFVKRGFSVAIPIDNNLKTITAYINYKGVPKKLFFRFTQFAKVNASYKHSYYLTNGYVLSPAHMCLNVKRAKRRKKYEKAFLKELIRSGRYNSVFLRLIAIIVRNIYKKRNKAVWLFLDRISTADDNGEFLCDYVEAQNNKNLDLYYILTKDSPDLERVKKKHKVLLYGTLKYKIMCLVASLSISSEQRLVKLVQNRELRDLWPKGVFLQHGLVEKDISDNWNRLHWGERLFIASAKEEYDYFLKYKYGFTPREVKLTGMPRTDIIMDLADDDLETKKVICFAPTWREELAMPIDPETRIRPCNEDFPESDYYKFYNALINDERILKAMRDNGYTGVFQLHPCFWEDAIFFEENDCVKISTEKKRYYDQYKDMAMVVTDYSSIAFEYAFINRLVIYSQFDKAEFYDHHSYNEGFFDYEKEGFGPVCYDYESTVQAIVNAINNHCKVNEEFTKRRNEFFAFFDGKNCERIYQELLKIKEDN